MIAAAVVALLFAGVVSEPVANGPGNRGPGPRLESARVGVDLSAPDTVKPRRRAVRLSEAYNTRLRIHKVASYAMLPLFAAQYAAGDQLYKKGSAAPGWAENSHGVLAAGVAGLFAVNTITGGLNWWESRRQEQGRAWRTTHAALMLLADAGFTATGLLAEDAEDSGDDRRLHRTVAITSIGVATVSYLMMLKPFRRD
ncbi:MAG: hypothetical protein Q8K55_03390 [Gemmatimonadaceae bacterium]|nr:hypothetical protein [Gemmatimonadaceae bacterium]